MHWTTWSWTHHRSRTHWSAHRSSRSHLWSHHRPARSHRSTWPRGHARNVSGWWNCCAATFHDALLVSFDCGVNETLSLVFHPFLVVEFDIFLVFSSGTMCFSNG